MNTCPTPHAVHRSVTSAVGRLGRCIAVVLTVLFVAGGLTCCRNRGVSVVEDEATRRDLERLDSVIESMPASITAKYKRTRTLNRQLAGAVDSSRMEIVDALLSEYYTFDLDSALRYARMRLELLQPTADRRTLASAKLAVARVNLARGREYDALKIVESIMPDTVDRMVRRQYYTFMVEHCKTIGRNPLKWRQRLDTMAGVQHASWIYNHANLLDCAGRPEQAIEILGGARDSIVHTLHEDAISSFLLSQMYLHSGDTVAGLRELAHSAVCDLSIPVRDYKSLYELASLLLTVGDVERAYRYINLAADDGKAAKSYANMAAVNELMPKITQAYELEMQQTAMRQRWFVGGISLLAVILLVSMIFLWRSREAASRSRDLEMTLNAELTRINDSQRELNARLTESNRVRDAYLMQYVNLCSFFLGRFEDFRDSVSATARTKGLPGIEKLLASAVDDRELKKFHANFDSTFLKLFPDFVEKFNGLLVPDKRVELRPDGTMPNELRTFALIRLGITDSEQIASFLRRSVTTVYNYRVKMRNAAAGSREELEDAVSRL